MQAATARHPGAPTPSIRALALALAALVSAGALLVLALGLSMRTIEAVRHAPTLVDLIPLAEPDPPPPEPQPPAPRHAQRSLPQAPAPLPAAAPATPADTTPAPAATPAPSPSFGDGSGVAGTGAGTGGGDGAGRGGGAPPPAIATRPANWVVEPGTAELLPFNPPRADRERVNGNVVLSCRVLRTRRLADCRVVAERPRNYGFGRAGLRAAATFEVNPPMRGGVALENERVEIPIAFNNRRPRTRGAEAAGE